MFSFININKKNERSKIGINSKLLNKFEIDFFDNQSTLNTFYVLITFAK